jgi:hypothetical protein
VEVQSENRVISTKHLTNALKRYAEDTSDTLKSAFELAMKRKRIRQFDNGRLICEALATMGPEGGTSGEVLQQIRKIEAKYPQGNVTRYLTDLQLPERGELVRYSPSSGKYAFRDPLFRVYAQIALLREKRQAREKDGFEYYLRNIIIESGLLSNSMTLGDTLSHFWYPDASSKASGDARRKRSKGLLRKGHRLKK